MCNKFLFFIYLVLFFTICSCRQVLWVNNSLTEEGKGTEASPFSDLSSALSEIVTLYQKPETSFEIILAPSEYKYKGTDLLLNYSLPNLSLTISSQDSSKGQFSIDNCDNLPSIFFEGKFGFHGIDSLELANVHLIIETSSNAEFSISDLNLFQLRNSCFNLDGNEITPIFTIERVSETKLISVSIDNQLARTFMRSVSSSSISFVNVSFWVTQNGGFFALDSASNFLAENTTFILKFTTSIRPLMSIFDISRVECVTFRGLNISRHRYSFTIKTLFSLQEIKELIVADLTLLKLQLVGRGTAAQELFFLENVASMEVNRLNVSLSNFEWHSIFRLQTLTVEEDALTKVNISNLIVSNSSFTSSSIFSVSVAESIDFTLQQADFRHIALSESEVFPIIFDENVLNSRATFMNLSISGCDFRSARFLKTQKLKAITMKHITCTDSTFGTDRLFDRTFLFGIRSVLVEIFDFVFTRNTLSGYFIFMIDPQYRVGFITRGTVSRTSFANSGVVTTNSYLENVSVVLFFSLFNIYDVEVDNDNTHAVLNFRDLYSLITDCNFEGIRVNSGELILFSQSSLFKNFHFPSMAFLNYIDDLSPELSMAYNSLIVKIKELNLETQEIFGIGSKTIQQFHFEKNRIKNISLQGNQNLLDMMVSYPYTTNFIKVQNIEKSDSKFFSLRNNDFQDISMQLHFMTLILCDRARVSDNRVLDVNGNGIFLIFEAFTNNQSVEIEGNSFNRSMGPQFLHLASKSMNSITLAKNALNNSMFNLCSIKIYVETLNRLFSVQNNVYFNNSLGKDASLIDIQTLKSNLYFTNNSVLNASTSVPSSDSQSSISVINLKAEGWIKVVNCEFQFHDNESVTSFITLDSQSPVYFQESSVHVAGKSLNRVVMNLFSKDVTVGQSRFVSNVVLDDEQSSITMINVDWLQRDDGNSKYAVALEDNEFSYTHKGLLKEIVFGENFRKTFNIEYEIKENKSNESIALSPPTGFLINLNTGKYKSLVRGSRELLLGVTSYDLNSMEIVPIFPFATDHFSNILPDYPTVALLTSNGSLLLRTRCQIGWYLYCKIDEVSDKIGGTAGDFEIITIKFESLFFDFSSDIKVEFRDCVPGEVLNTTNGKAGCVLCPYGQYSFNPNTICKKCPVGANCLGGVQVNVNEGYWRRNTFSDQIYACNSSRCKGGYNSSCAEGYQGPLCSQCDFEKGFLRTGSDINFSCGKCNDQMWKQYLAALVLFLGFVGYEVYFIYAAVNAGKEYYQAVSNDENHVNPSFGPYVNLVTTYFQILTIISVFDVGIFRYFISLVSVVGEPSEAVHSSLDCIFLSWELSPQTLTTVKISLLIASPLVKLLLMFLYFVFIKGLNRNQRMLLGVAGASLFLLEQPQIVSALIQYLTCRKLDPDDPRTFIQGNENVICGTDQYNLVKHFLVYPAMFFFCLLPLALLGFLYTKRKQDKLNSEWTRCTLGVLYNGLKKDVYYWGILGNYSKIILIMITKAFIVNSPQLLAPILIAWLYAYKALLTWKRPYLSQHLFLAENFMVNAYLVTIFCAYFMIGNENRELLMGFYLLLIAMANLYAISYVMFVIYLLSKKKAVDGLGKFKHSTFWKLLVKIFIEKRSRGGKKEPDSNSLDSSLYQSQASLDSFYTQSEDQNPKGAENGKQDQVQELSVKL